MNKLSASLIFCLTLLSAVGALGGDVGPMARDRKQYQQHVSLACGLAISAAVKFEADSPRPAFPREDSTSPPDATRLSGCEYGQPRGRAVQYCEIRCSDAAPERILLIFVTRIAREADIAYVVATPGFIVEARGTFATGWRLKDGRRAPDEEIYRRYFDEAVW